MKIYFAVVNGLIALSLGACVATEKSRTAAAPPLQPVLAAPPPPWSVPETLVNKTPEAVIEALGPPDMDQRNEKSRVMDFRGNGCTLSVVFRPDNTNGWRSHDVFVIQPDGTLVDPNPCYHSVPRG